MEKTKALIIGGGIAGPAVALFLKKAGLEPTVFESHERGFRFWWRIAGSPPMECGS